MATGRDLVTKGGLLFDLADLRKQVIRLRTGKALKQPSIRPNGDWLRRGRGEEVKTALQT